MNLINKLKQKALKHGYSKYHVVAIGYSKKGNVLGVAMNKPANHPYQFGTHAEAILMMRYGHKLNKIMIARFGNAGDQLPIEPCEQCKALANSFGIKIETAPMM